MSNKLNLSFPEGAGDWLERCWSLARERLPKSIFEEIPLDVWKAYPLGRQVLVRRFPRTSRIGSIVIPEADRAPVNAGWALVPGPWVSDPGPNVPHCWPWDPMELVGRPLVLLPMRGVTLRMSNVPRSQQGDYLSVHVGDIQVVQLGLDDSDWQAEKPAFTL